MNDSLSTGAIEQTERIEVFLSEFRNLLSMNRAVEAKRMPAFFSDFRNCLNASSSTARFNLLDVTGVGSDDVKHSSLIAWFLTPDAQHACGTVFLQLFLKAAQISIPEEHLRDCHVRTEFSGNESMIDILICRTGQFVVYIENKTVSDEGVDQIDREYRDMLRVAEPIRVPHSRMFPVFLTPDGRSLTSGDARFWQPVSYRDLAREFLTALPELRDRKIAFLVEDLIRQYKRLGAT